MLNKVRRWGDVGVVLVGVQDLQFIALTPLEVPRHEKTTVAPALTRTLDTLRYAPLQVQLIILEHAPGMDTPGRLHDGNHPVPDRPSSLFAGARADPFIKVGPIKENDGIGRRSLRSGVVSRRNHGRDGLPHFGLLWLGALLRYRGQRDENSCEREDEKANHGASGIRSDGKRS
ncbi:MAG: hypothetical protein EB075_13585 [Bacteroidetes bacterium]|nr:hypothetical protein [Bacteroidota bacterium]